MRPDGDWYPPSGIPAPSIVNLTGNRRPEIVAPIPDGFIYAISPKGKRLWRYDYARGAREDLRVRGRRRRPEPRRPARARLRHLRPGAQLRPPRRALRQGQEALRPPPPQPGHERQRHRHPRGAVDRRRGPRRQARDRGATFDHGIDVYRVPRSNTKSLPWPTGRDHRARGPRSTCDLRTTAEGPRAPGPGPSERQRTVPLG